MNSKSGKTKLPENAGRALVAVILDITEKLSVKPARPQDAKAA